MKFSAQEEYGLRCLIAIARQGDGGSMTIPEIAEAEGISSPHAAKLLAVLRKASFIRSTRGHSGGYTLAKSPSEIVVGDVLAALGGRLFEEDHCDRYSGLGDACPHQGECSLSGLWQDIQSAVDAVVSKVVLSELLVPQTGTAKVKLHPRIQFQNPRALGVHRG